jgi:predicted transposase
MSNIMIVQRTIRLDLNPTSEQAEVLLETMRQQTVCFNEVVAYEYPIEQRNGVELHRATYASPLRLSSAN